MKSKLIVLLILFGFAGIPIFAQSAKTDSLLNLLNKAKDDTGKVTLSFATGVSIIYQNPPNAVPYFMQGATLGKKLNFYRGLEKNLTGLYLAYSFMGKYDSAKIYIDSAIPYARLVKDTLRLALVYLNKADVSANLQNFSESVKNCDTAIAFAEYAKNKSGLARIYAIMSDVYLAQKQFEPALASLDKSQRYFEEIKNMQMVGMSHFSRATIFQETDQQEKALPFFKAAIHIGDSIEDFHNLSSYYGGYAQSLARLKRLSESETAINKSLEYARQTGNRKQEGLAYDLFSNIYAEQKDFKRAVEEGLKAYNIMKEEKDIIREYATATNLSEGYYELGNMKEAFKYLKISRDLNDSMIRQQFNDETAKLQTTFEVKGKDKEIQLLNKDKELQLQTFQKQRAIMIGIGAIALMALGGIWLLMNRNKLKQRMKELELRNQIAADLHDEVGSSLSSIHMLSQMANAQSDTPNSSQKNILNKVSTNAKETMDRMSDIVWMIKPGETEAGSLRQRMERFAAEIAGSRNIELKMDLGEMENVKVSMSQRKNIYLIFKEALNNAAKYSSAEKIDVSASLQNKLLTLMVQDNGKGFDLATTGRGNGLDNMRNRAKESGGSLKIDSSPGAGTSIVLNINV